MYRRELECREIWVAKTVVTEITAIFADKDKDSPWHCTVERYGSTVVVTSKNRERAQHAFYFGLGATHTLHMAKWEMA